MREAYFFLPPCLEPSVAQPPLPLQEFLPLQPASPVLQPPLPLQSFLPLQSCLSLSAVSARAFTPAAVSSLASFFSSLLVAQPPLPLQLFLPLQPASPVLQPPLPLQSFLPLQSCLSLSAVSARALAPALSTDDTFLLSTLAGT